MKSSTVAQGDDILPADHNTAREDVIRNGGDFAAATGSGNAFVLSVDAAYDSYDDGDVIRFEANHSISGAATVNVNALGAKAIRLPDGTALATGDINSGDYVTVIYDSTSGYFRMVSSSGRLYGNSNAKGLHYHQTAAIAAIRNSSTGNGAVNYAHGLGVAPKWVKVTAFSHGGDPNDLESKGHWDGTNTECVYKVSDTVSIGIDTTNIVHLEDNGGSGGNTDEATVSVDETNVTLTWTVDGGTPSDVGLLIECGT